MAYHEIEKHKKMWDTKKMVRGSPDSKQVFYIRKIILKDGKKT